MRRIVFVIIPLLLYLSGCMPEELDRLPEKERTSLHMLNLYSGLASVDIFLENFNSDLQVIRDLRFQEAWPQVGYASLLTGALSTDTSETGGIFIRVLNNLNGKKIVGPDLLGLLPGTQATLILIENDTTIGFVKTLDVFNEASDSTANVRFMNLNASILSCSLRSTDGSISVDNINFLNYSSFEEVLTGNYEMKIINDLDGETLHNFGTIGLQKRKAYSFYLGEIAGTPVAGMERLN